MTTMTSNGNGHEAKNAHDGTGMGETPKAPAADVEAEEEEEEPMTNPCRCTFAVTGAQKTYQAIFICRTCCDGGELLCICEACANHCHELHDELEYLGMGQSYCDCSCLGERNGCKLLETSEQEVMAWKFPKGSISQNFALPQQLEQNKQQERQYIMDAFEVSDFQSNREVCRNLVEQASELVTHSKETFWLNQHQHEQQVHKEYSWCDLEKMAWRIYQQNKRHYNLDIQEEVGGAEWWVQVKKTDRESVESSPQQQSRGSAGAEAVDLHYDKDESLAENFGLGSFPTLSTVTYLTEGSNPTVLFSRTYEQEEDDVISDMMISHPVMGKHLVFDGRLLHGAPAHVDLRSNYLPAGGDDAKNRKELKKDSPAMRVTLLVNIWANRKPAGIHPLDQNIRDAIKKKIHKKVFKKKTDFAKFDFEKIAIPEHVLETEEGGKDDSRRIQLPFVCKGITWENEDDDSTSGLVIVTCPPPEHTSGTLYIRFGPGLQAYLDQPYDAIEEGDGVGGAFDGTAYVYEDAYI